MANGKPDNTRKPYLHQRASSFYYALKGIKWLFTTQPNFVVHTVAAGAVTAAGFYFGINRSEWLAVVLAVGFVWVTEALNTAIEFIIDLVSPEYHPLAGKVKDIAAAAVLFAALTALIIGAIVFLPKIIHTGR